MFLLLRMVVFEDYQSFEKFSSLIQQVHSDPMKIMNSPPRKKYRIYQLKYCKGLNKWFLNNDEESNVKPKNQVRDSRIQ